MRRQGERPELIRWRLCGASKTWSLVEQRRIDFMLADLLGMGNYKRNGRHVHHSDAEKRQGQSTRPIIRETGMLRALPAQAE